MIAVNEALILSVVQKVLKNPVGQFEFPNNSPTKFAFSSIKKKTCVKSMSLIGKNRGTENI